MVLGWDERERPLAVREVEDREFLTAQKVFQDDGGAGAAEALLHHHRVSRLNRFIYRTTDDGALAGGEARGFHDDGSPVPADVHLGLLEGVEAPVRGRRYARLLHERFGEGLGALDLGGALHRSENRKAPLLEHIDDAGDQRRLGTDEGQVHLS